MPCCCRVPAAKGPDPVFVPNEERKCTDVLFCIVFIAFWAGMIAIAAVAFSSVRWACRAPLPTLFYFTMRFFPSHLCIVLVLSPIGFPGEWESVGGELLPFFVRVPLAPRDGSVSPACRATRTDSPMAWTTRATHAAAMARGATFTTRASRRTSLRLQRRGTPTRWMCVSTLFLYAWY